MADQKPVVIHLKVGEEYLLRLEGRGTTGYEWQANFAGKKIIAEKKTYVPSTEKGILKAGENSDELFSFKGLKKGKTELHLTLSRAWEKETKPIEEKEYILIVD
jgi:predicted secreted protein